MALKFTKAELKEAIATIYAHLCEGKEEKDVMEIMGLSAEDFEALRSAMFEAKAEELRTKPPEHVYVEYTIKQLDNVKQLSKMIGEFAHSKQYNAMVGAVRARSEIYDKLIKTGTEFGVIRQPKAEDGLVAGLLVANLTNSELKKAIVNELKELNAMMKSIGERTIIDMEPGTLHYGPAIEDDEAEVAAASASPTTAKALPPAPPPPRRVPPFKTAKAATAKVSGGRKVVKERMRVKAIMP